MARRRKDTPLREFRTYGRSRAVRLPDFDYACHANIHLTICADRGKPFTEGAVAGMVCDSVERCCELCKYELFGSTLMPDHLHALLSSADSGRPIGNWLRRFKSFTTNEYVKLGGDAPLWQESGHDHVCRTGETAEKVLIYMIDNPVRAGLVERWQDWAWSRVFIDI